MLLVILTLLILQMLLLYTNNWYSTNLKEFFQLQPERLPPEYRLILLWDNENRFINQISRRLYTYTYVHVYIHNSHSNQIKYLV